MPNYPREFSVAAKLPPDPGLNDTLVTLGDHLRRAINALGYTGGESGAGRWFREAFTEVEQNCFFHFEQDELPPETQSQVELSPIKSLESVGHQVERVFQQRGAIELTMWIEHRALFVTVSESSGMMSNPISVDPSDASPNRTRRVRRTVESFRDQFPYQLGEPCDLPSWSNLDTGLQIDIRVSDERIKVGSNGFGKPRPKSRSKTTTARLERSTPGLFN